MRKLLLLFTMIVFASSQLLWAQTKTITGKVTGQDDGMPIPGVSVVVKGTTMGTVTNYDGVYNLTVSADATSLLFSFVGMESQEQAIRNQTTINVVLKSESIGVDEVMVVAYGTAKKSSFTGSAKSVSAQELVRGNKESLDKALSGKVAGVRVSSTTGDPGASGEINIRGVGSISAGSSPLYVIDGVPIKTGNEMSFGEKSSNVLSSLNPDDIESMTILKDAAAASLYGSRAANGVVIITTKKGKDGKTKAAYTGEFGITDMAVDQFEMMSGPEMVEYARHAYRNYSLYTGKSEAEADAYAASMLPTLFADPTGKTSTDWRKEVYRKGYSQDHQFSVSGGNEKTKFYTGVGYNKTNGIVLGSSFNRLSGRMNLDHKVNDFIDLAVKQMISRTNQEGFRDQSDQGQGIGTSSPLGILFAMDPTAALRNDDGSWNGDAGWGKVSHPRLMLAGEDAEREFVKSKTTKSMTNVDLNVRLFPTLNLKSVFGYDYTNVGHQEFWSPTSVNGASLNGLAQRDIYQNDVLTSSTILNYSETYKEKHNLTVLGGFEVEDNKLLSLSASAKDYYTDKLPELSNGQSYNNSSAVYESALVSFLANANYNYDSKYYLSASFRRDGSSRLGADNRWGNFWSVAGAWRISGESFLEGSELFSDLKLRASFGTNGTLPSDYFVHQSLYSGGGYGSGNPAIYWSQYGNDKLSWEKSNNLNVGVDWNIFQKVSLTVEYYNKDTRDLLFQVPSSLVTGFGSTWQNLGKIRNSGLEIEINSTNIKRGDFSWNTLFNFTNQSTIIKELPEGKDVQYGDGNMYIHREGESMYSYYLPVMTGVNSENGLAEFLIDPTDPSKGVTNTYAKAGKTIVGKALPDVVGGLGNTFKWKGVDLNVLLTYQFGGDLFDYPGYFGRGDGIRIGNFNTLADVAGNYWTKPGDVVDNPKPIYRNPYRSDRFSSRHILSTDNIRLKEISIGYTIPVKKYINSIRVYGRANNLAMIWQKTDGIDPDVPLNGYRQVDTPVTRSFMFGVNVEL